MIGVDPQREENLANNAVVCSLMGGHSDAHEIRGSVGSFLAVFCRDRIFGAGLAGNARIRASLSGT
jgi:hypothetical protein